MSKTFKSASSERKVRIWEANLGVAVCVEDPITNETTSTQITPSDAPALALAILEAAGVEAEWQMSWEDGSDEQLKRVAADLAKHVQVTESRATEAKEQAELEAEALELANAFNKTDWDFFPCNRTVEAHQWLAVARKAREMAKETPNA